MDSSKNEPTFYSYRRYVLLNVDSNHNRQYVVYVDYSYAAPFPNTEKKEVPQYTMLKTK